jgi:hypothetical protein
MRNFPTALLQVQHQIFIICERLSHDTSIISDLIIQRALEGPFKLQIPVNMVNTTKTITANVFNYSAHRAVFFSLCYLFSVWWSVL